MAKRDAMYLNPELPTAGKKYPIKMPIAADGVRDSVLPAKKLSPNGKRFPKTTDLEAIKPITATIICTESEEITSL